MDKKCGACSSTITDNFFMECSNEKCMTAYDLQCLKINRDAFKTFTLAYKKKWVCPECVCLNPKRGNIDTPVRGDSARLHTTITPDNVNSQRGTRVQFSPTTSSDVDSVLLDELKQFRLDIMARLDSQANAIILMQDQYTQTKKDLDKLIKIMTVIEEKVNLQLARNIQSQTSSSIVLPPEEASTSSHSTFAEAVNKNKTKKPKKNNNNTHSQSTAEIQNVNKCGATKSATTVLETQASYTGAPDVIEQSQREEETGWTTVQYKKHNRLSKNVTIGRNTEIKGIVAMERMKYLHVWRLHPETTQEAMTDYIKNLCGPETSMKIEKIKHKTARDYSSFIIGVSEKHYTLLNNAEVWPLNAEFNEWIWFRKQPNSPLHK
ncbi:hypothetical protein PYW07_009427 [Mythimna separata]|uniref:Zinc finger PHD-type domain-containing protein n=1 Tax=Mythimna separata TaxID=271217 RepID=A0AAD8DN69_MYTSE|nr:hypothetical protein PYW07_009427 [Mythimna separata]